MEKERMWGRGKWAKRSLQNGKYKTKIGALKVGGEFSSHAVVVTHKSFENEDNHAFYAK